MAEVIGGIFSGRKIYRNTHRKYLYMDDPDGQIRFSPKNVEKYQLKDDMSNKKTLVYIVRWKNGHKSLVRIPKEYSEDFVHGCEFGPLSKEEGRNNSAKGIFVFIFIIALFLIPILLISSSKNSEGHASPLSDDQETVQQVECKWATWDGTAENMPPAYVPVYVTSAEGNPTYGYGNIQGIARNRTTKRFSYIQITFALKNSNGAKIGTCLTNLAGLSVGEDWQFNAYCPQWTSGGTYEIQDVTYY